jgi:hypothetical protein
VVPLILSFVSDRQTNKLLTGRCFNGVWLGWAFATINSVTGSAGLTAPDGI